MGNEFGDSRQNTKSEKLMERSVAARITSINRDWNSLLEIQRVENDWRKKTHLFTPATNYLLLYCHEFELVLAKNEITFFMFIIRGLFNLLRNVHRLKIIACWLHSISLIEQTNAITKNDRERITFGLDRARDEKKNVQSNKPNKNEWIRLAPYKQNQNKIVSTVSWRWTNLHYIEH